MTSADRCVFSDLQVLGRLKSHGCSPVPFSPMFTAQFSPEGKVLYCTYLGGSAEEWGQSLTTDADGNLFVTGWTTSADFPLAAPIHASYSGSTDAFVARINPEGTAITFSTLLGDIRLRISTNPDTVKPVWLLGYGADFKVSAVTPSATVKQGDPATYQLGLTQ